MSNKLTVRRGRAKSITFTVTDSAGAAFDLSGYTGRFMVKRDPADPDSEAAISATAVIATPATGIAVVTLTPTLTDIDVQKYSYEFLIDDGANDVQTLIYDEFKLLDSVARL